MARAAADQQRRGADSARLGSWRRRTATAALPLRVALVTVLVTFLVTAVAPLSSGSTADIRVPHAVAQTASRIYLPLALRLAAPLPAPPQSPTAAVPPSATAIMGVTPTASPLPFDPSPTLRPRSHLRPRPRPRPRPRSPGPPKPPASSAPAGILSGYGPSGATVGSVITWAPVARPTGRPCP